jgi:hypothetical protein
MPRLTENVIYELVTRRSGFQYLFTTKHHGGDAGASCWLPALSLAEEFVVFDDADGHGLADDEGSCTRFDRTAKAAFTSSASGMNRWRSSPSPRTASLGTGILFTRSRMRDRRIGAGSGCVRKGACSTGWLMPD